MKFTDQIKDLIGNGQAEQALKLLTAFLSDKGNADLSMQVLMQQGKWKSNQRNQMLGMISNAEASMTNNQVNFALLSLMSDVDKLETGLVTGQLVTGQSDQSSITNNQLPTTNSEPIRIFISYSHEDEDYKNRLVKSLAALSRMGKIKIWEDRQILGGAEWSNDIFNALKNAHITVLMVSDSFVASDFCYGKELQAAIDLNTQGKMVILPVVVRPSDWSQLPFGKFQALPKNAKAVTSWSNQDEAWMDVAQSLRKVVGDIQSKG
jgi:Effector-associated domain 11/TIR domain